MKLIKSFRGRGFKSNSKKFFVMSIKFIDVMKLFHNTPSKLTSIHYQLDKGAKLKMYRLIEQQERIEKKPIIWNFKITSRFSRYFHRSTSEAYVVAISNGMVAGNSSNWVIFADGTMSLELSREFGAYGGKNLKDSYLLKEKLNFNECKRILGKVAVVTTSGYNNFHHWNYDCLPRLFLLKQIINFEEIDYFVIHHNNLPFQLQSLKLFGINTDKIIQATDNKCLEAELLYVPSLPSRLGTVSTWVIDFLRDFYFDGSKIINKQKLIYISRKNVTTRKIVGNQIFEELLLKYGFIEIFPEDHTVSEMAQIIKDVRVVISVHGSGLSNICFINPGTIVIDILAPFHQDSYYWQISNICDGKYIGFFAEGLHPSDNLDLVKSNIDDDLIINFERLEDLIQFVVNKHVKPKFRK